MAPTFYGSITVTFTPLFEILKQRSDATSQQTCDQVL